MAPKRSMALRAISFLRQVRQLALDLGVHLVRQFPRGRDQDGRGKLVMLGLGKQVGRHELGVGALVRDDQDLARAGDHVDVHLAEDIPLRRGHVDVARAHDLVHLRDRCRAIGHGGDCLGAADLVDLRYAGNVRGDQDVGVQIAAGDRRAHDELLHARDFRRDDVHQHRRGIAGLAAGHIDAGAPDRPGKLAQDHAVRLLAYPGSRSSASHGRRGCSGPRASAHPLFLSRPSCRRP